MKFINLSFRNKIIVAILLFTFLSSALSALFLYNKEVNKIKQNELTITRELVHEKQSILNVVFASFLREADKISTDPFLIQAMNQPEEIDHNEVQAFLNINVVPNVNDFLALINLEGVITHSSDPTLINTSGLRDRKYFQQALRGLRHVDVLIGKTTREVGIFITAPILYDSDIIGVYLNKVQGSYFRELIYNQSPYFDNFHLTDQNGVILISNQSELIGQNIQEIENTDNTFRYPNSNPSDINFLTNTVETLFSDRNTTIVTRKLNNKTLVSGITKMDEYPFYLAYEKNITPKLNEVTLLSVSLESTDFIIGVLLAIGLLILSNYYFKPIVSLKKASDEITQGNYNVKLDGLLRSDDIGKTVRSFKYMIDEVREHEQQDYDFITSASHQLRTPFTEINFQLELLRDEFKSHKNTQKYIDRINEIIKSSQSSTKLVSDLLKSLELSQLQFISTKDKSKFIVCELIESILESFNDQIEEKSLTIKKNIKRNLHVYGQKGLIKYALLNVIENAIHYSNDNGTIEVKVEQSDHHVKIWIKDEGIGIPKTEQIYIFDRFYRAQNAYLKKSTGTGLGLPNAKSIIEMHKGTIEFESKEGEGTTVIITLPLKDDEN